MQGARHAQCRGKAEAGSEKGGNAAIGQEGDDSCTPEWDAGTDIELVADALPGFGFGSWTGACAGTSDSMCFVELGATTVAGAVFRPLRRFALQIIGRGTVTSSDVRCSRSCSTQQVEGSRVEIGRASCRERVL